jgi:hypothetical protein
VALIRALGGGWQPVSREAASPLASKAASQF